MYFRLSPLRRYKFTSLLCKFKSGNVIREDNVLNYQRIHVQYCAKRMQTNFAVIQLLFSRNIIKILNEES